MSFIGHAIPFNFIITIGLYLLSSLFPLYFANYLFIAHIYYYGFRTVFHLMVQSSVQLSKTIECNTGYKETIQSRDTWAILPQLKQRILSWISKAFCIVLSSAFIFQLFSFGHRFSPKETIEIQHQLSCGY